MRRGSGVGALGHGFGNPGGVVGRVEASVNFQGLSGASAGEGLDSRRRVTGCGKGAGKTDAQAVEIVFSRVGLGHDAPKEGLEVNIYRGMRHGAKRKRLLR